MEFSKQFLAYLAQRELRYPRDIATGQAQGYRQRICDSDSDAQPEWALASGKATLLSFTVYHKSYSDEFRVPYNVALVALQEGPTLISTIVAAHPDALRIGMDLRADLDAEGRLIFRPGNA